MSFHKSKSLTARVVVLAGLVDGLMPRVDEDEPAAQQQLRLEEQRRLFFVGMTRTTDVLVFSSYSELPADHGFLNKQVQRSPQLFEVICGDTSQLGNGPSEYSDFTTITCSNSTSEATADRDNIVAPSLKWLDKTEAGHRPCDCVHNFDLGRAKGRTGRAG
jgi:ATP-dependent exoDNAse (exonuclease V) beta subunit